MKALQPLIYPLISALLLALLATGILLYMAMTRLRAVRLGIGMLGGFVIFGSLGLILAQTDSLVVSFAVLSLVSFGIGVALAAYGSLVFNGAESGEPWVNLLTGVFLAAWSWLGFTLVGGLLAPARLGWFPSLSVALLGVLIPTLFKFARHYWLEIPQVRYRRWYFDSTAPLPVLEPIDVVRVAVRFTKKPDASPPEFEGYTVGFPGQVPLGELFRYFIDSHNNRHRDYRRNPIQYVSNGRPLGWLLYQQVGESRQYLDTDKTLIENGISDQQTIFAESFTD